jgi:DNA-binding response OmpR family regulator
MTPHRILVVDDFPDAANIACMLLKILGHEVLAAYTGQGGLDAIETFRPDIMILDIGLPDLSGYEIVRKIRQHPEHHDLYVAAITGWGQLEDRVKAIAAGFDQHVLKPVDADKLMSIVAAAESSTRPNVMRRSPLDA